MNRSSGTAGIHQTDIDDARVMVARILSAKMIMNTNTCNVIMRPD